MAEQNQSMDPKELLKHPEQLRALMSSPEVRQLAQLLNSRSGGHLQSAAEQAKQGDSTPLKGMIESLSATQEGAKLISQIQSKLNR